MYNLLAEHSTTSHAPEVDLLVAVLSQVLKDVVDHFSDPERRSAGRAQAVSQAGLFVFSSQGDWADSRRHILALLDIDDGYFQRIARRYVDGRRDGTVAATRSNRGEHSRAGGRAYQGARSDLPPPPPLERPVVVESFPALPTEGPLVERVLAAFRYAAPLGIDVRHLRSILNVSEPAVRSAIGRLNTTNHRIVSLGNNIFTIHE